jgi:hypothetical protein
MDSREVVMNRTAIVNALFHRRPSLADIIDMDRMKF